MLPKDLIAMAFVLAVMDAKGATLGNEACDLTPKPDDGNLVS
jgi:hypothetical protein